VVVLLDAPETLPATTLPRQTFPASREKFLALGQSLAGQTNALVLIAWGHGGRQGDTPVFHVRGPRLAPGDFRAFAEHVPRAESRWILCFRGSGYFARELASPGRQLLTSENQTMFASDPIGMPLLVRLVAANPAISFEGLAEESGRATAQWYAERGLLRTEEPTFWLPGQPPRPLIAGAGAREMAASLSSSQTPSATPPAPTALPAPTPAPSSLPPAWPQLPRVEAQKYPEADGVVLRRRVHCTLSRSSALQTEQEDFIQVLTLEGKHLGDFDLSYSPPEEDLVLLDCEVLRPDGRLARLDPEGIRPTEDKPMGDYTAGQRKFFSLPGVGPGAVLRAHFRREWKKYPLPHYSLAIPLAGELPVIDAVIEVEAPKELAFRFLFDQAAAQDPLIKQTAYGSTYSWAFENLPPVELEVLAPPGREPHLLISTFPDWGAFVQWYAGLSRFADEVTPELASLAADLTRQAKTDLDKVRALYQYVAGLRYVAVPLGVNSLRPHAAAHVLRNQFGDCKDKANLLNTLLRAVGVEARLALAPRFGRAHPALPMLAFNHAISRVSLGSETYWADTTDEVCRFGLLPPGDAGRLVLVIDEKSAGLTQLPLPVPSEHQFKLRGRLECSAAPEGSPMNLSVSTIGYCDYQLRACAQAVREQKTTLPLLAVRFRPVVGAFELARQEFTAAGALGEDFAWEASGRSVGVMSAAAGRWLVRAPFWLPKQWDLALARRKTPLCFNEGYPLSLDEEFAFQLLAGARDLELPAARQNKEPPLRWRSEWAKANASTLVARLQVELACGELTEEQTPRCQQQLRALLASLAAGASFVAP
jgi:transglutaminase-like putative cysteine protease